MMQSGQTLEFYFHFVAWKVSGILHGEGTTSPHPQSTPIFYSAAVEELQCTLLSQRWLTHFQPTQGGMHFAVCKDNISTHSSTFCTMGDFGFLDVVQ